MDVGTAKPTPDERASVPHHMLDLRTPGQPFSAGEYQDLARAALQEIRRRGRIPLVAGGTGFYFRALTRGLFEGPGRSAPLRARLRAVVDRGGTTRLYRALRRVDPACAVHIAAADSDRIVRAYEVWLASGKPMSWWQALPRQELRGFRWLKLGIVWSRPALYARIDARVCAMFAGGLVDEVQSLLRRYPESSPAFKAIGYRQVVRYLQGTLTREQAIEDTQRESRRYAKRQITWFRADPGIRWLCGEAGEQALQLEAARLVDEFLG
jgi:tRNA dimethylallyltransferase